MTPLSGLAGAFLHLETPATPMLLQLANPVRQLFVINGLHSGQPACCIKVHHAVLDGQAGMLLAQALFDLNKQLRAMPRRAAEPAELPGLAELAAAARQHDAAQYIKQLRRLPEVVKTPAGLFGRTAPAGPGPHGQNVAFGPKPPLNLPLTGQRGSAAVAGPLAVLKALAVAHQAKPNDIVLLPQGRWRPCGGAGGQGHQRSAGSDGA